MALPESHRNSYLQLAYVRAVIAEAGYGCSAREQDYGIDLEVTNVSYVKCKNGKNSFIDVGPELTLQLKATVAYDFRAGYVVYDLDADAHNRLAYRRSPTALVVMCLPKTGTSIDRLGMDDQGLTLRHCCYWYRLPTPHKPTSNTRKVTIHIDQKNVLDVSTVQQLMTKVSKGVW